MKYVALTGATGLLGAYLLQDLLRADVPVAVLVRSNRMETATERVEAVVRRFEKLANRPLPRPVVLEADLRKPGLGLKPEERAWTRRHVGSIVHNAASLSFVADDRGEPYRSNVDGTRNVLELCEETGIRKFHHVSTAYVCGLRKGTIYESQLDEGQEFGNDYEKSKFAAENMARSAAFLDSVTVFRPAIIVGDSINGYTSTYHGFYTPIKILAPLLEPGAVDPANVSMFAQAIGMNPSDAKNFVPVDWISKVMTSIIRKPSLHDSCYHLTGANRVPIDEMSRIISEGIIKYKKAGEAVSPLGGALQTEKLLTLFQDQMETYKAYWKDDPTFDMTNTLRAAPQYPPIKMDAKQLEIFVRFAIESRFGWPKPKKAVLERDVVETMQGGSGARYRGFEDEDAAAANDAVFGLRVSGSGGGDWTVRVSANDVVVSDGLPTSDAAPLATMNANVFRALDRLSDDEIDGATIAWENGTCEEKRRAVAALRSLQTKNA